MKKRVKLILEYDMGMYEEIPEDLKEFFNDTFFQSDVIVSDMEIIGVKIDAKVIRI